jgi:gamma-glutamyltranspeptidase/glutathione hydrolase
VALLEAVAARARDTAEDAEAADVERFVRSSQRNTAATSAEPAFISSATTPALLARGHRFASTPEIGAATGIEFLPGGGVIAAAEPVRRGGGSAMVESP